MSNNTHSHVVVKYPPNTNSLNEAFILTKSILANQLKIIYLQEDFVHLVCGYTLSCEYIKPFFFNINSNEEIEEATIEIPHFFIASPITKTDNLDEYINHIFYNFSRMISLTCPSCELKNFIDFKIDIRRLGNKN